VKTKAKVKQKYKNKNKSKRSENKSKGIKKTLNNQQETKLSNKINYLKVGSSETTRETSK